MPKVINSIQKAETTAMCMAALSLTWVAACAMDVIPQNMNFLIRQEPVITEPREPVPVNSLSCKRILNNPMLKRPELTEIFTAPCLNQNSDREITVLLTAKQRSTFDYMMKQDF